jgi:hypothetical protein
VLRRVGETGCVGDAVADTTVLHLKHRERAQRR